MMFHNYIDDQLHDRQKIPTIKILRKAEDHIFTDVDLTCLHVFCVRYAALRKGNQLSVIRRSTAHS